MDDFEWNVEKEGQLLEAMIGHKPVGINKYFQMAFISDKLSENLSKEVESEKIWRHLETMYNLEALDESESIPFPNEEKDFILPESDFGSLLIKKEEEKKSQKGRETPKGGKEIKKEEKSKMQRRDSKDSKEALNKSLIAKKEIKKEPEKAKNVKTKSATSTPKDESKATKSKVEEPQRPAKRPTRGSIKSDDSNSNGKSSPVTVATPSGTKRRRI